VAEARERAERIRVESERELTAASHRRDSINTQLADVRRMLATLSGSAPVIGFEGRPTGPVDLRPLPEVAGPVR
jgi:hypothetical protein